MLLGRRRGQRQRRIHTNPGPLHRHLRVGYFEQDDQVPVTEETRAAVRNCAQALSGEGFEVVPFKLKNLDAVKDVWTTFFTQSGGMLLREMYAGQEDVMSPTLREF